MKIQWIFAILQLFVPTKNQASHLRIPDQVWRDAIIKPFIDREEDYLLLAKTMIQLKRTSKRFKLLVEQCSDDLAKRANQRGGSMLLYQALKKNDYGCLYQLLASGIKPDNRIQADGETLLHGAIFGGDLEAIKLLLSFGADPDYYKPETGKTAVQLALSIGTHDMIDVIAKRESLTSNTVHTLINRKKRTLKQSNGENRFSIADNKDKYKGKETRDWEAWRKLEEYLEK